MSALQNQSRSYNENILLGFPQNALRLCCAASDSVRVSLRQGCFRDIELLCYHGNTEVASNVRVSLYFVFILWNQKGKKARQRSRELGGTAMASGSILLLFQEIRKVFWNFLLVVWIFKVLYSVLLKILLVFVSRKKQGRCLHFILFLSKRSKRFFCFFSKNREDLGYLKTRMSFSLSFLFCLRTKGFQNF